MKGRFEAEGKMKRTALTRVAALSFFALSAFGNVNAQDLPPAVVVVLEQMGENGASNAEQFTEYLCALMEHPLNINAATEEELSSMLCLSTFQVASLLEYRQTSGAILSLGELALVDGFNTVTVEVLSPFITVGGALPQAEKRKRVGTQVRIRYAYPDYAYLRYKGDYGEHLKWGITAEQDAGERAFVPDFLSGYLALSGVPLLRGGGVVLKSGVVGDFSVRLGQGLTAWNGFSITGMGVPSAIIRYPQQITPYTSSDEQNFCRGAGMKLGVGKHLEFVAFYSNNAVDARCDSVYYYTRPDDGKHITESAVAARHGMREQMAGGAVVWRAPWLKIGVNGLAYSFDHLDGRPVHPYDSLQRYDGWWGNVSLDFTAPVRLGKVRGRVFGEAAVDGGLRGAFLAGGTFALTSTLEVSALARYYSPDYIAPHSGAYTASSGCYNEHGCLVNIRWNGLRRITLTGMADAAYHPVERYRIDAGSSSVKVKGGGEWKINSAHSLSLLGGYYWKSYVDDVKYTVRLNYQYASSAGLSLSSRGEVSVLGVPGYLLYQEAGYAAPSGLWNLFVRGTVFHVDDWDNRIYCYERDLYGTFSVPAAYGRGFGLYLFGNVRACDWLKFSLKTSWTNYISDSQKEKFVLKVMVEVRF